MRPDVFFHDVRTVLVWMCSVIIVIAAFLRYYRQRTIGNFLQVAGLIVLFLKIALMSYGMGLFYESSPGANGAIILIPNLKYFIAESFFVLAFATIATGVVLEAITKKKE